jgi:aminoglycoside 3-N-acetyltransferase
MAVDASDITGAIRGLGLGGMAVCLHASLRSFGRVDGGAAAVVDGILAAGCTLLVPSFTSRFAVAPPPGAWLDRNGWPTAPYPRVAPDEAWPAVRRFAPASTEIDREMGAVAAAVVRRPGRARGAHPLCSFAAVGPQARELVRAQTPLDVFGPLDALARAGGSVVLAGVGLEALTLLHLAEQRAGRTLFRRWAIGASGTPTAVAVGGCSRGFGRLEAELVAHGRTRRVGASRWVAYNAADAIDAAAALIRREPEVTHCGDEACERCRDAVLGGPILSDERRV